MKNTKGQKGFTLIEILVVIGLIAILAAIVLIAINPARQFAQARNSQRTANVETILNALGQDLADHKGISSCSITASSTIGTGTGKLNLSGCLSAYISNGIPMDPNGGTAADTKYEIGYSSTNGRYTVCAPEYDEDALGNPGTYCVTR
jgi:prepilin-type N-terminal cleavage/methylation domain-containing protein